MYVCMYVCMFFRNGFTIEIYKFMHSLRTFWHMLLRMPSHDGVEIEIEDSEDRRPGDARMSPDVWKMVAVFLLKIRHL